MADGSEASTIFALSSGAPPAAIAVLRVSGERAGEVLVRLAGALPEPRRAVLRALRDPRDDMLLDRALLLWFPGPESATGEDVAELHVHGGRAVVAAVSRAIERVPGVRRALAGEFTRRALLNRRIGVAEAEGLRELLLAETESHRRAALALAEGGVSRAVAGWRDRLVALSAEVEAAIDFAEEGDVAALARDVRPGIGALRAELDAALARPSIERLRDGRRVVIAGPPNSGKSTLLNTLVERQAAIVSPIAGTTRDVIEVSLTLNGSPIILYDTAGFRETSDQVERIGIDRARTAMGAADVLLWLGDEPPPVENASVIWIEPKADRLFDPPLSNDRLRVSAATGIGISALLERVALAVSDGTSSEDVPTYSERQRSLLREARTALGSAEAARDEILRAEDLRAARVAFEAVVGGADIEDVMDALFSGFCVGK